MKITRIKWIAAAGLCAVFAACGSSESEETVAPAETTVDSAGSTEKVDLTPVSKVEWAFGMPNGDYETGATHLIVSYGTYKKFTRAVCQNKTAKIKYVGEKKAEREPVDMEYYWMPYETRSGANYKFVEGGKDFSSSEVFLYNDAEKWGGVPANIVYKDVKGKSPKVSKEDIEALQKMRGGRKIIYSEVIQDFTIKGKPYRVMLVQYKNTKFGMFQIVLKDENNQYFTAEYPAGLDEEGKPNWRADAGDEVCSWSVLFVGRVAEGLFLVMDWAAPEGTSTEIFIARNGRLEQHSNF